MADQQPEERRRKAVRSAVVMSAGSAVNPPFVRAETVLSAFAYKDPSSS